MYNEQLRDLLHGEAGDPPKLTIMHDDAWGTVVNNVSTYEVTSMEQINLLMAKAAKQRAVQLRAERLVDTRQVERKDRVRARRGGVPAGGGRAE